MTSENDATDRYAFGTAESVAAYLAAGGDQTCPLQAAKVAERALTVAGGGLFVVHRGEDAYSNGWVVTHVRSGGRISGVLKTKRLALILAERLAGLQSAGGTLFDWESPRVARRAAEFRSAGGDTLAEEIERLRLDIVIEDADARKPLPLSPRAPFKSLGDLRAHLRVLAASGPEGLRANARWLADEPTLAISPAGHIVLARRRGRRWQLAYAQSAAWIASTAPDAHARLAAEFADWMEARLARAGWLPTGRTKAGSTPRLSRSHTITLACGDFDIARGRHTTEAATEADALRQQLARRRAADRRAARLGCTVADVRKLLRSDRIELEVPVTAANAWRFAGSRPPASGDTVLLSGTVARHPRRTDSGVVLWFSEDGLEWRTGRRRGKVEDRRWELTDHAIWSGTPAIYLRREPYIDRIGPHVWLSAGAADLARACGITEAQLQPLELAIAQATSGQPGVGLARGVADAIQRAAARYWGASADELDRAITDLRAVLDEYDDMPMRHDPEFADLASAPRMAAVAAERQRQGLAAPTKEYVAGHDVAKALYNGAADTPRLSGDEHRGGLDYAESRLLVHRHKCAGQATPGDEAGIAWNRVLYVLRMAAADRRDPH